MRAVLKFLAAALDILAQALHRVATGQHTDNEDNEQCYELLLTTSISELRSVLTAPTGHQRRPPEITRLRHVLFDIPAHLVPA
jgi:hypothetical protein